MIGLLALANAGVVQAAESFERLELKVPGRVVAAVSADVDGDEYADVLVFWRQGVPPASRARVSVYLARQGRLADRPVQVTQLPGFAVAFDVGDADGDGRADVLLLSGDGVWSLAGRADGTLAGRPTRLVEAMTLAAIPNEDRVPPMPLLVELDSTGRLGLLVPTLPIGPLALYERGPQGAWTLKGMLRVRCRASLHTTAEDFRSSRDYAAVFQHTIPRLETADFNGDGRRDLLFFQRDEVSLFIARPDGSFSKEPDLEQTFGLLTEQERTQGGYLIRGGAGDFDGDGRADLVFNKSSGGIANMTNELRVYRATGPKRYPDQPELVIRSDGYGAFARPVDVDGDGRTDLVRPHVKMGILAMSQVLLTGRIDVDFQIHLARDGRPGQRPDFRLRSSFGVDFSSNQELSGLYPIFGHDFTGDGLPDVVIGRAGGGSGADPDRLEIRAGRGSQGFEDEPVWALSLRGTRAVQPFQHRAGALPGLLIWFPSVSDREGDVWVLNNTAARRKKAAT